MRRNLEAAKKRSVAQLLFKCARLLNDRAIARANEEEEGFTLRQAHTRLLPHLDFEGTRMVDLARKMDVTKQAVSQLVSELELAGFVELIPDPDDGRAKRVRITRRGAEGIQRGLEVLGSVEKELERAIGKDKMRALHDGLLAVEAALE
jgi:DNA-binding MarR family transcriptional regulator